MTHNSLLKYYRLCKEESHIPLRCEEVEKQNETDMRTYIENKMTEAMVRTCYKCRRRFYKLIGCNNMTCVCGAHMCYVCRTPLDGNVQHLNEDGRWLYHWLINEKLNILSKSECYLTLSSLSCSGTVIKNWF